MGLCAVESTGIKADPVSAMHTLSGVVGGESNPPLAESSLPGYFKGTCMCSSALATGESLLRSDRGESAHAWPASSWVWLDEDEGVPMDMLEGASEGW